MKVEEIPKPAVGPGEVLVKVRAVGICGSDVHGFSGETGRRTPDMVMGHEISGEIADTGERVVVQPVIYCGRCKVCREGKTSICLHKKLIGVNTGLTGGLSEYISVPRTNIFPVNRDIPFPEACLVEPLAVGFSAVRQASIEPGDTVFIAGAGMIGLAILLSVMEKKPCRVFVSDNNPRKLRIAENFGGTPIDFSRVDPSAAVMAQTEGMGADVSFEAVGLSASVRSAQYATRPGGRVVWVGNAQKMVEVDMQDIVVKAKSITGIYCYTDEDFAETVNLLKKNCGRHLVEKQVLLEDAPEVYAQLARGEIDLLRGVVVL